MKILFLLFLSGMTTITLFAQNDTLVGFYDARGVPSAEGDAVKFSLLVKQDDHYKKLMVDRKDNKVEYIAYFTDVDCKNFDGPYKELYKNGKTHTSGNYYQNKKTGLWKSWTDGGMLTDSLVYREGFIYGLGLSWDGNGKIADTLRFEEGGKGIDHGYWNDGQPKQRGGFVAGRKEGLWVYYYKTGNKCQEVNYLADSAISYTCYDVQGNPQQKDCIYEQEAEFPGGEKEWIKWLVSNLRIARLPEAYYRGEIYGQVWIQFVVDIDGKLTDIRVTDPLNPALDKAALDIIRRSPKWNHAVQFNRPVKAYRKQPITFSRATSE